MGVYVLALQFSGSPGQHEMMRTFAQKMMLSFSPGDNCKLAMGLEYKDDTWKRAAGVPTPNTPTGPPKKDAGRTAASGSEKAADSPAGGKAAAPGRPGH
jgi:hypothetical protein